MDFLEKIINIFTFGFYEDYQSKNVKIDELTSKLKTLEQEYEETILENIELTNTYRITVEGQKLKVKLQEYEDLTSEQKLFAHQQNFVKRTDFRLLPNSFYLEYPENLKTFNMYLKKELFKFYEESEDK